MAILAPYSENPIRDPSPYRRMTASTSAPTEAKLIEFLITSVETSSEPDFVGLKKATVVVMVGPLDLLGDTVVVYDHSGCIFDIESMNGYTGWAKWNQSISLDTELPCDTPTDPHWCAFNRCCEPNQGTYRVCEEP